MGSGTVLLGVVGAGAGAAVVAAVVGPGSPSAVPGVQAASARRARMSETIVGRKKARRISKRYTISHQGGEIPPER